MTRQKQARPGGQPPEIQVLKDDNTTKTTMASKNTTLLGGTLHQNSTWQGHLEIGEDPLSI